MVACGVLLLLAVVLTVMNILFIRNIRAHVNLLKRGMTKVKIDYSQNNSAKTLIGWTYSVELGSIMRNPVSHSSSFVRVYADNGKEVILSFSSIKNIREVKDNYLSVVFGKRIFL